MTDPQSRPGFTAVIGDLAQDGAALTGAGLITYGADLVYRPAGFIVGGIFLLAGAWLFARKAGG